MPAINAVAQKLGVVLLRDEPFGPLGELDDQLRVDSHFTDDDRVRWAAPGGVGPETFEPIHPA